MTCRPPLLPRLLLALLGLLATGPLHEALHHGLASGEPDPITDARQAHDSDCSHLGDAAAGSECLVCAHARGRHDALPPVALTVPPASPAHLVPHDDTLPRQALPRGHLGARGPPAHG